MFNVHFLPARYGDCIWIEYGDEDALHNILIDGGTAGTRHDITSFIDSLPSDKRHFELMVVTHVDRDHIEGILSILESGQLDFTIGDFWFNGWDQLQVDENYEPFGPEQGERLSAALVKHRVPWNKAFKGGPVCAQASEELPIINLGGGMKLTILSPYPQHLVSLKPVWVKELRKNGLQPGFGLEQPELRNEGIESFGTIPIPDVEKLNKVVFKEDRGEANGSSIAFMAEFDGKRVLFCGDAFPTTINNSLNKCFEDKAQLDLVKLSHHGSKHNTSPSLIEKLKCKRFVFSTNGSNYYHPDHEAVSWVIKRGGDAPELMFNYRSIYNEVWDNKTLRTRHGYTTTYPVDGEVLLVEV
jgi:metal-dependent hydrolase (beta-lactamase superfamily II)